MFEKIKLKVIDSARLSEIRKQNPKSKIVFCTGCFDILQSGHAVFFSQCKEFGDILVVGVGRDSVVSALKGPGRPVNPENNRLYLLAALQDIDFAVLNDSEIKEGKIDFTRVVEELRPDIFVLNQDDSGMFEKQRLCDELGIKLVQVSREVPKELEPTSTTRIIDKINFKYRAPLRIDFAGGWTDVPYIMDGKKGYVSNITITPYIEYKNGQFNFSGYPRGSGLSTSTAAKLLEMLSAKTYNADNKTLSQIGEDLFIIENKELNWAIGRQDQYSIAFGGFNCFEFGQDYAKRVEISIPESTLKKFKSKLLLFHTGVSRNAQSSVEQVYTNFNTEKGRQALEKLSQYGYQFAQALKNEDFNACALIMEQNYQAQKELAPATSNQYLDAIYQFAKANGMLGGKISGAGGGGAFIFYCSDPVFLKKALKKEFVDCFEIDFDFNMSDIKTLNKV
jgi:cytidyltransferase-like protein